MEALRAEARRYEAQVRRLTDLAARDLAARSALEDAELTLRAVNARRVVAERGLNEISSRFLNRNGLRRPRVFTR